MKNVVKLIKSIKNRNSESKKICFFLGNTKKLENKSFFLTPARENQEYIFFGAVVFNDNLAKRILKYVDGNVDYIFVDIEKKIQSKNSNINLINIERSAKDYIKKSKLNVYKANDLAINSAETLINNLFLKDKRGIGGKKILILGLGNIGFKLSLKLVESGANIYAYRRNQAILSSLADTINFVKPLGTLSKINILNKLPENLNKYDIIITTADKNNIISLNHAKKIKKKTVLIDAGKGNFSIDAIKYLRKKNHIIYRLDTTSSYFSYIQNIIHTQSQYKNYSKIRKIKNYTLVNQGIVGNKNDIIVDDIKKPKKIFGCCDGSGGLKQFSDIKKKEIFKIINKYGK